jgi:hypothetical protein
MRLWKMRQRADWNPVQAAGYGVIAGFICFVVQLTQVDGWARWPEPELFEKSLVLLLLLATCFAVIAVIRNRLVGNS